MTKKSEKWKCKNEKRPYFVKINHHAREICVSRPDCHNWKCPYCARINASRWGSRIGYAIGILIEQGEEFYFLTLTSHEALKTRAQTERVFPLAWSKLYKRMRRINDEKMIYVCIPERHKDGRMHAHIIANVEISERWLKDNARACGFGYQAKVKRVENPKAAIGYVTKYMRKSVGANSWSKNFRRVRTSARLPKEPPPPPNGKWGVILAHKAIVQIADLMGQGYELSGDTDAVIDRVLAYL